MTKLGNTDLDVYGLNLGGNVFGWTADEPQSFAVLDAYTAAGGNFVDTSDLYGGGGRSEEILGNWLAERGNRDDVVVATKVGMWDGRPGLSAKNIQAAAEDSLRRLKTDHLDLWQVHEVAYAGDPERHFMKGGVIEALDRAKQKGLVRFVGFTGHKDPALHLQMLSYGYPFDSCQMPLNCFDASFRSFEQQVVPEATRQGIAVIGMKTFGGEGQAVKKRVVPATDALRYSMSLPVAVTVTGIDSPKVLRQNLGVARGFRPLGPLELERLRSRYAPQAVDGRFELYKTTAKHEADVGRRQHGFPPQSELGG